ETAALALSPDGKLLAAAGMVNQVKLWELSTGKARRPGPRQGPVTDVACSPNGKLLATGAADGTARLWDAVSGKELRRLGEEGAGGGTRTGLLPRRAPARRGRRGWGDQPVPGGDRRGGPAPERPRQRRPRAGLFAGRQDAGVRRVRPGGAAVGGRVGAGSAA